MKTSTVFKILAVSTSIMILLLNSCQKEVSDNHRVENQIKASGVVADDPNVVSKVPFMISTELKNSGGNFLTINTPAVAKGKPPKSGIDATPPAVNFITPSNGSSVSGTVGIEVNASDNVGVASVILDINGSHFDSTTIAPYNFSWNAASVAAGTYTLTATAKDGKGNSGSNTITVAVNTAIVVLPPATLPGKSELFTPPVGYQGNEGSCVVFASAYAARSIEQYYRTNASDYNYSSNIFSPEYVYNQIKAGSSCFSGTSITTCLDFLYSKGVCTWQTMPYSDMNGCDLKPTSAQDAEATNYKISNYSKMINIDITAIKTMLYSGHAVIVSLTVDNGFVAAGPGYIWSSATSTDGQASHTVALVGYDDAKHAYKIMNSWGTGWGDYGYSWVDYDFFPTRAGYYVYVMNY